MAKINIFLVDDHTILREGLKGLLSLNPDFNVVGESDEGRKAISEIARLKPQVVIMDIRMEGLGGIEATKEIKRLCPETKVIVLTMYCHREYIYQALKAGADGYLLKGASFSELEMAIKAVVSGHRYLSPMVADQVVDGYLRVEKTINKTPLESLTKREREIVNLLAEGKSDRDISQILCISPHTVRVHLSNIMKKLGVKNRLEMLSFLHKVGWPPQ